VTRACWRARDKGGEEDDVPSNAHTGILHILVSKFITRIGDVCTRGIDLDGIPPGCGELISCRESRGEGSHMRLFLVAAALLLAGIT
jgi:hypothetical protein